MPDELVYLANHLSLEEKSNLRQKRSSKYLTIMLALIVSAALLANPGDQLAIAFARTSAIAPPLVLSAKPKFRVSVLNGADSKVTLMTEGCSWGYEMFSFEVKEPGGKVHNIERIKIGWDKNFPRPWPIEPKDISMRLINFGDGTWTGFPVVTTDQSEAWHIRVVMTIKDVPASAVRDGFWTGKVTSRWAEVKL